MVRVRVEARVTTKLPVSVRVRDQKQISRDCALASELVQARAALKHQQKLADATATERRGLSYNMPTPKQQHAYSSATAYRLLSNSMPMLK